MFYTFEEMDESFKNKCLIVTLNRLLTLLKQLSSNSSPIGDAIISSKACKMEVQEVLAVPTTVVWMVEDRKPSVQRVYGAVAIWVAHAFHASS